MQNKKAIVLSNGDTPADPGNKNLQLNILFGLEARRLARSRRVRKGRHVMSPAPQRHLQSALSFLPPRDIIKVSNLSQSCNKGRPIVMRQAKDGGLHICGFHAGGLPYTRQDVCHNVTISTAIESI